MQKKTNQAVRVAIQRPIHTLLDYSYDLFSTPEPGVRVKVPLGPKIVTGVVVENQVESELEKLKTIKEIIDEAPVLDQSMLSFLKWASQYYFYPIGEVIFHALPANLRKGKKLSKQTFWFGKTINDKNDTSLLGRAPKQRAMFEVLSDGKMNALQLSEKFGNHWRQTLNELIKKDLIESLETDSISDKTGNKNTEKYKNKAVTLTEDQAKAVSQISKQFSSTPLKPILLHGITGSGKTEVYLSLIEPLLKQKKQVLVLVPEIGLTPQLYIRFKQRFPDYKIKTLHSGMSDLEREQIWLGASRADIQIIIGTRSAVFTPMKNLGAIIVDEEHDASLKQQEGFLYHGRDMAIKRAHDQNIPIVLGSATPSIETLYNANIDRYHYVSLDERPGASEPPEVMIQDVSSIPLEAGLSNLMLNEIGQHLQKDNQVMLFLNRRGFAPILMCPDCGWHSSCAKCDIGMTYHASTAKTICHHCGAEEKVQSNCPACNSDHLTTLGQGTERIEEVLNSHFPDYPVIRVDRDTTAKKGALESKLQQVKSGKPVILIGTQMLTKGHDFPNLTLVGILDIDQALFSMDFRAHERLVQQVLQVAGRAGRAKKKGKVILQTTQPKHPIILSLLKKSYAEISQQILNERQLWHYPPLGAQALIRVSALELQQAKQFIDKIYNEFSSINNPNVELLGPMPSVLSKRANRYRLQLLLSAPKGRKELHHLITAALPKLLKMKKAGGVRWLIDIDPVDFL